VAVPGGIALCGNRSFVTLIDTSGAVQWSAGPWGNFFPERAIPALDGGVVVLCSRFAGSSDLVLAKVTSAGDTAWVREMVSNEPPQGLALREDTDGTVHVLSRANLVTHETYFDANGNITAGSSWEGEAGRYCWAAGPWNDGWLMVFRQNNFTDYQISRHVQGSTTPCLEEAPAVALSAVIPPTSAAAPSFIGAPTLLPVSTAMAALPVSFVQQLCTSTDTGDPRPGTSYPMAWPVPADAELCLRAPGWEAGGRCVILDHAGRVVWGGFLSSGGTIRVDTANWSSGTYCAIVADDAHVEHVPVMVVH
jgi:hypothetical protein